MIIGDVFPKLVEFKVFGEDSFIIIDGLMKEILLFIAGAFEVEVVLFFILPHNFIILQIFLHRSNLTVTHFEYNFKLSIPNNPFYHYLTPFHQNQSKWPRNTKNCRLTGNRIALMYFILLKILFEYS